MFQRVVISACVAFQLMAVSAPVLACGETLFRTGTGMRYYGQAQQGQARILMVADASQAREAYREKLYAGLRKAGHTVVEVPDASAMGDALSAGEYDLVVAHQREIDRVLAKLEERNAPDDERQIAAAPVPQLIPVLAKGSRQDELAEAFRICLREGASLGQVLRAVGEAMRGTAP